MTRSEKGYFKKYSGLTGGDSVYIKLFDAIESQKQYDEKKIKEKFKHEKFSKQISVAKNNLYSHILKSLNQASIGSSMRYELRHNTVNAEILFNKGLTSQALKLITKLKSSAMEIEEFDTVLMLLNLEKSIHRRSFAGDESKTDDILKQELDTISRRKNLVYYQKLFDRAFYISTKYGYIRSKKDETRFEDILNNEYMKDARRANSILAKIHYCEIFFYYFTMKFDFRQALKWNIKAMEAIDKNETFLKTNLEKYFSLYQNRILQYFYLGRFKEVDKYSDMLTGMLNDKKLDISDRMKAVSLGKLLCIRFYSSINSGNFDSASRAMEQTRELMDSHSALVDNSIKIILYNVASSYNFIIENYTEALEWINRLLNDPEMKYFVELFCNARWFELLIHFELKNYSYIDDVLKTNMRYISQKERLYGIEKIMIKFFADSAASDKPGSRESYQKLLDDLKTTMAKKTEAEFGVDYYNIAAIVRSRIEGKPLRQLMAEDVRKTKRSELLQKKY